MTHHPSTVVIAQKACIIHEFVWDRIHGDLPNTLRIQLFAGFMAVVLEHHDSILVLLKTQKNYGSAFALMRPLVEAAYRAQWMYTCASDQELESIRDGRNLYPGFKIMADEIEAKYGTDNFFGLMKDSWKSLSGYTHTGLEQLARRFDHNGAVIPSYGIDEINEVINSTTAQVIALAIAFCHAIQRPAYAEEISERYIELNPLATQS
jgi:Family of unknown function (DUF6988)